jgi:redox-sensitive bicupin YhaK (pirin superfamily)
MITKRPANERGHANHGWLDTYHTFSFANYHDPRHMGFRDLRVINDDIIQAGQGFGTHGHRDMEIITYVIEGALEHRDSMGTGAVLRAGDVQHMTAGKGLTHSEFNHSADEDLRLLQIWIFPAEKGLVPGYMDRTFPREEKIGRLRLIASPDGAEGSLRIHQDVRMYASILQEDQEVALDLAPGRHAWVQVVRGQVELNGVELGHGDGAAVSEKETVKLKGLTEAEFLLFDLN